MTPPTAEELERALENCYAEMAQLQRKVHYLRELLGGVFFSGGLTEKMGEKIYAELEPQKVDQSKSFPPIIPDPSFTPGESLRDYSTDW